MLNPGKIVSLYSVMIVHFGKNAMEVAEYASEQVNGSIDKEDPIVVKMLV